MIVFAWSCTLEEPVINVDPLAKYDFVSDTLGLDTPEEVAMHVIEFLATKDTAKYLDVILPYEAHQYFAAQNLEYRPEIKDTTLYMQWHADRFDDRWVNYFVRAGYILEIMKRDKGISIDTSMIDTITFEPKRIKQYGGMGRFKVGEWADLDVKLRYEEEDYYFEVPQILKLKDKWFLYYPEFYIRNEIEYLHLKERKMIRELKADDFWL
jgi:hypothetical protein